MSAPLQLAAFANSFRLWPSLYISLYIYWTWPKAGETQRTHTHTHAHSSLKVQWKLVSPSRGYFIERKFSARPYYLMWLVMKSSLSATNWGAEWWVHFARIYSTPTADKINYFTNVHVMGASFAMGCLPSQLSAHRPCHRPPIRPRPRSRPGFSVLQFPGWSALNCHKNALSTGIFWPTAVITGCFVLLPATFLHSICTNLIVCRPSSRFYLFICAVPCAGLTVSHPFFLVHFFGKRLPMPKCPVSAFWGGRTFYGVLFIYDVPFKSMNHSPSLVAEASASWKKIKVSWAGWILLGG